MSMCNVRGRRTAHRSGLEGVRVCVDARPEKWKQSPIPQSRAPAVQPAHRQMSWEERWFQK